MQFCNYTILFFLFPAGGKAKETWSFQAAAQASSTISRLTGNSGED